MSDYGERRYPMAVAALLECDNYTDAAKRAGINVRTLHRWLERPEFRRLYNRAWRDALRHAAARLAGKANAAADVLLAELGNADPSIRLRAVNGLVNFLARFAPEDDLEERVAELEEKLKALATPAGPKPNTSWISNGHEAHN
jgi:hypothetical protein